MVSFITPATAITGVLYCYSFLFLSNKFLYPSTKTTTSNTDIMSNNNNSNKRIKLSSSSAIEDTTISTTKKKTTIRELQISDDPIENAKDIIIQRANEMNEYTKTNTVFTDKEINTIINSIKNIVPPSYGDEHFNKIKDVLLNVAHISHKDWTITGKNSEKFAKVLLPTEMNDITTRQMFERILLEGNWDGAADAANKHNNENNKPWAVLVTGVNGIRKTTSIYQSWFPQLLQEALQCPVNENENSNNNVQQIHDVNKLPCGSNSFFRQLDHMIATLCNEEFINLYTLTRDIMKKDNEMKHPTKDIIQLYSNYKAGIFARYRTISELLGVILLREAQLLKSNCMLETSGRDVAMFYYVDHFFPTNYNKLALHFQINDLTQAKISVDNRMVHEIQTGIDALQKKDVFDIINANAGGPYGSEVLDGVQTDSDKVWKNDILSGNVGKDWYKATIQINAYDNNDKPWTAQAIKPDGTLGTEFTFQR